MIITAHSYPTTNNIACLYLQINSRLRCVRLVRSNYNIYFVQLQSLINVKYTANLDVSYCWPKPVQYYSGTKCNRQQRALGQHSVPLSSVNYHPPLLSDVRANFEIASDF